MALKAYDLSFSDITRLFPFLPERRIWGAFYCQDDALLISARLLKCEPLKTQMDSFGCRYATSADVAAWLESQEEVLLAAVDDLRLAMGAL